jgi:hypothetical protein
MSTAGELFNSELPQHTHCVEILSFFKLKDKFALLPTGLLCMIFGGEKWLIVPFGKTKKIPHGFRPDTQDLESAS